MFNKVTNQKKKIVARLNKLIRSKQLRLKKKDLNIFYGKQYRVEPLHTTFKSIVPSYQGSERQEKFHWL